VSDPADPFRPTVAAPEPTPTVPPAAGTHEHPPGTAAYSATPPQQDLQAKLAQLERERPEALVGGALVGGLLAGLILKRITRGGR
jgi:hypothetical protein